MTDATERVVSYNIRALKDDRDALVRVIRALEPDVLCLQEAPRHPFSGHRISALAADCGLTWGGGDDRGRMSTTLLTGMRLDVLASGHRLLPVVRPAEPRGWAFATCRLPGYQPFVTVSLHLSLKAKERPEHAKLLRDAKELADNVPAVLAGDVNETSKGSAWQLFAAGLDDPSGEINTFPAKAPVKRIDTIFTSPVLRATRPQVDLDQADLKAASDHLPLWADLDLSGLAVGNSEAPPPMAAG